MKCPKCSYNQSYNNGMICSRCKYRFLLDPKRDKYADNKFVRVIAKLQQQGEGCFTFHQFYAQLFYASRGLSPGLIGFIAGFAAFGLVTSIAQVPLLGLGLGIGAGFLVRSLIKSHISTAPAFHTIRPLWDKWKANTVVAVQGFLSEPGFTEAPAQPDEGDLYDYGVEGILIVDRPIYVDLLVRNKVHSEFRLLVMASDAYPHFLLEKANALLAERLDLPIYLLHDAATAVSSMTDRFKLQGHHIFDLGLSRKVYEMHPRLKPFKALAKQPLDVLSLNELRILLRRATQEPYDDSGSDDGGWVIFDDTSSGEYDDERVVLTKDSFFDDAMEDSDADGGDFG